MNFQIYFFLASVILDFDSRKRCVSTDGRMILRTMMFRWLAGDSFCYIVQAEQSYDTQHAEWKQSIWAKASDEARTHTIEWHGALMRRGIHFHLFALLYTSCLSMVESILPCHLSSTRATLTYHTVVKYTLGCCTGRFYLCFILSWVHTSSWDSCWVFHQKSKYVLNRRVKFITCHWGYSVQRKRRKGKTYREP